MSIPIRHALSVLWILAVPGLYGQSARAELGGQDPDEVLIAGPVATEAPAIEPEPAAAEDGPPAAMEPGAGEYTRVRPPAWFAQNQILFPAYFSAYVPPTDRTELNLALLLSQTPGIQVALGWGAATDWMMAADLTALGASHQVGLRLQYRFLPETSDSTKPAVAFRLSGQYFNHRTLEDQRRNIIRGNAVQAAFVFSKELGALARGLNAAPSVQTALDAFRLHAAALADYLTGREHENEEAFSRVELGARAGLEASLDPSFSCYLVLDTLPDWVGGPSYYLGGRYQLQSDLAIDAVLGRIFNGFGVTAALSWLF